MSKTALFIFGGHGSGKSTLVKNILLSDYELNDTGEFLLDCFDFYEKKTEYGFYTLSKGKRFVAIGKYSINCGGADSIEASNYYPLINKVLELHPDRSLLVEGVITRSPEKMSLFFNELAEKGYNVKMIYLNTSIDKSFLRVTQRSGKKPNVKIMEEKIKNSRRLFDLIDTRFEKCVIDVDEKTPAEIYTICSEKL